VPRVAAIGLRLAHDHGPNLRCLADENGVTEPVHEGVKPLGVAGCLDTDRYGAWEHPVELLNGVAVVGELLLANFAGRGIENRDLLLPRVQVTSDECHDNGLLCVGAVALGLAERSSSAGAFS